MLKLYMWIVGMQDPAYRETVESKLQSMKDNPELAGILEEIEAGGPAAMMKCVEHPADLSEMFSTDLHRLGSSLHA